MMNLLGKSANCPQTRCIPHPELNTALTIISSLASVVGSLLIIGTFIKWKDLRTIARMILVFLAIADLFSGIGYIFGAGLYIHYYIASGFCSNNSNETSNPTDETYDHLCAVQSFITTLMPMASFFWTANLAIYLFFSIALRRINIAKILMVIFHITAWGIPLVTCIVLAALHRLGNSSRSSGGWCWIKLFHDNTTISIPRGEFVKYYAIEFMAGKGWEIAVCVLSLILCISIKVIVWRRYRNPPKMSESQTIKCRTEYNSISYEKQLQVAFTRIDQWLIWVPVVFLLLRLWSNIRFFISLIDYHDQCVPQKEGTSLYNPFLVAMQSICDPGQGWSNALLFVLFHPVISRRLCPCVYSFGRQCCTAMKRRCCRRRHRKIRKKITAISPVNNSDVDSKPIAPAPSDQDHLIYNESLKSNGSSSVLYYNIDRDQSTEERRLIVTPDRVSINSKT